MDKFSIITPTGDRELLMPICAKLVKRQTIQPYEWIIIDDGHNKLEDIPQLDYVKYIRREPLRSDPYHTLPVNLRIALDHVTTDKIIIVEDDDWYHHKYFETYMSYLKKYDIVGKTNTLYYHYPSKSYRYAGNKHHASLCETGFTSTLLEDAKLLCENPKMVNAAIHDWAVDLALWGWSRDRYNCKLFDNNSYVIGLKGMPGRRGYSSGHNTKFKDWTKDKNHELLKKYMPIDEYNFYMETIK